MGILSGLVARALKVAALLLLLLATLHGQFTQASAQGGPAHGVIVVIVSVQSKLHDVPRALLKRIFLGEPSELDGARALPFNHAPDDAMRQRFDQLLLGFDTGASGRYWVDRRIRGQGLPPRVVPNVAIVRAAVAKLPGAVSYVAAEQLDATVRALRIDGIPHTAPEYPLKY
jgi:hypothetical protein